MFPFKNVDYLERKKTRARLPVPLSFLGQASQNQPRTLQLILFLSSTKPAKPGTPLREVLFDSFRLPSALIPGHGWTYTFGINLRTRPMPTARKITHTLEKNHRGLVPVERGGARTHSTKTAALGRPRRERSTDAALDVRALPPL